jgi:hypothetical protein
VLVIFFFGKAEAKTALDATEMVGTMKFLASPPLPPRLLVAN